MFTSCPTLLRLWIPRAGQLPWQCLSCQRAAEQVTEGSITTPLPMNSMVASMALPPNLMNNNRKRTALCLLGATLCVFMAFGAALYFGRYPITLQALLAGDAMAVRTFTVLRLPRAVMALAGGFGLGVAGFVYQTVFRNPLASPDIIGVSSGASVGAAFAILFVSSGTLGTTVCAFAGGLAAVFLSLGLAAAAPGRSKMNLVLAGICRTCAGANSFDAAKADR